MSTADVRFPLQEEMVSWRVGMILMVVVAEERKQQVGRWLV